MRQFTYQGLSTRVRFGSGTAGQAEEMLRGIGGQRALLLSTPQQADDARVFGNSLGELLAATFCGATMHTPTDVTEQALALVTRHDIDSIVALGGGSTIGLSKAIALRTDLPQLVIPTTYAGSEMTPILGQTENGLKTTQRTLKVLPEAVIYDVELTLGLPPAISGTSGINAIAHAVEGLYAQDGNPIMSLAAIEGIRALAGALPRVVRDGRDLAARTDALYGSWLCGMVLGSVGMALHHKLCHTVGGTFNLPHAETHTILLPHALAYNAPSVPEVMRSLSTALDHESPVQALFDLSRAVGAPASLRELGMPRDGIDRAAALAVENAYWNPRPFDREAIRDLLERAWEGEPPSISNHPASEMAL